MATSQRGPDLKALWEEHLRHGFETKDTPATLDTVVENAYVNHVPVITGGQGMAALGHFYSTHFIPRMPKDTSLVPISRTVGHDLQMDWMLPGVAQTGKQVEVPFVVIVQFEGDKLAHEHIY